MEISSQLDETRALCVWNLVFKVLILFALVLQRQCESHTKQRASKEGLIERREAKIGLKVMSGSKAFRNILVVVKQTPYEQYLQLKSQGKAPVALRWERLKNRYEVHKTCVDTVTGLLNNLDCAYTVVGREEMHRN